MQFTLHRPKSILLEMFDWLYSCFLVNVAQKELIWTALGVPLLDIAFSLGVFKELYSLTFRNGWLMIDFWWKLHTVQLLYKTVPRSVIVVLAVVGCSLHVLWTIPLTYLDYTKHPSKSLYKVCPS